MSGVISGIVAALFSNPLSNICFPKGTLVETDQGSFAIETLTVQNTLGGFPIVAITKTIAVDDYLIEFLPHALSPNVPCRTLRMSKDHAILHQHKLKKANEFPQGRRVPYNGEILYNVLLDVHGLMNVHGVACETLHPDNAVAKLYRAKLTPEIVERWNSYVIENKVYG